MNDIIHNLTPVSNGGPYSRLRVIMISNNSAALRTSFAHRLDRPADYIKLLNSLPCVMVLQVRIE